DSDDAVDVNQTERTHETPLPDCAQRVGKPGMARDLALDEQDCFARECHSTLRSVDRARGDPALVSLDRFRVGKLAVDGLALLPLDVNDVCDFDVIQEPW